MYYRISDKWKKSKYITGIILLLAVAQMAMIFNGTRLQRAGNESLQKAYSNQLKYRTLAIELGDYSDYLTNEVREFAVTEDMEHFENYWNEARKQMHREKIIEEMEKTDIPDSEERDLERAKYFSDTLMHIEISSMRLTLESKKITEDDYKENAFLADCVSYVRNYPLESDYQCEDAEKSRQAAVILYGSAYDAYKELIDSNISRFQTAMELRLDREVQNAKKESKHAFLFQISFGLGEIVVLILILVIFQKWYIKPVKGYKKTIERQHGRRKMFVEPEGVWELQEFAREFNALSSDMLTELAKSEKIERELIDAKRQAEKASQVKTQFLTQMSHELRTPLNTISGYLFLLEDTTMSGEQRRYTENVHLATDILLEEINEILDYSKLESGRMTFEEKNFSLFQLTETLKSILENEAEQRNLSFQVQMDPQIPEYVHGDPLKLKQVLTNLVYNGFKFTQEGGVTLKIKGLNFSKTMCVLEFIVEDTGIGIKKEQRQVIFDAFAQADESITRKYGGTGLGLPICRKIVQEMSKGKYTLLLESEEGKGSRFYFDMDFVYGKEEKSKKKKKSADKRKKRNLSILIVDDNKVNLILEAEVLHKFGYTADAEDDAEKVLSRMEQKAYDVIFLDISMPKISGYELCAKIRSQRKWDSVKVVALTANIGEEVLEKVKEARMDAYLPKPIPMEQLKELLEMYTRCELPEPKRSVTAKKSGDLIAFEQLKEQFYGDEEAVKELFDIFAEDNAAFEETLKKAAEKEDWETMEMEVHRLKGVSGNLLFGALEAAAKVCLLDIRKHRWEEEHAEGLYEVFAKTMGEMNRYCGRKESR